MKTNPTAALADFLEAQAAEVTRIEAEADAELRGAGGQAAYQAVMRRKAELLAGLADAAAPLAQALDAEHADAALERLEDFSASASNSLRIGSVFYMSALLYPDDHKPGEPNNLQRFAAEVRGWA